MHFVFSPIGSAGDVHPMLGVAVELHRRGHEVVFVANGYFQDTVERFGLRFVELGSREHFYRVAGGSDLWHPRRAFAYVFRNAILPILRGQYTAVAEHARREDAVVVANCLGFGALIAHERLGMPLVTVHIQPAVFLSRIDPPALPGVVGPRWFKSVQLTLGERFVVDRTVCPELNRFRQELGRPPVRHVTRWWHSPQLNLCLFPEWFAAAQPDWPHNVVQTDFPLWDERTAAGLAADVREFLDAHEPPLAFTPGSSNVFGKAFFAAAVEACERLRRPGLLLTRFSEQIPEPLPGGVRHFPYIPFSQLLPRVAALVHHGGIGTTAQALAAGVPQLIMPLAHDQFDNAARVERLGVGESLRPSRFRGPQVAARLAALLQSDRVGQACRSVSQRMTLGKGISEAADVLEHRAYTRKGY